MIRSLSPTKKGFGIIKSPQTCQLASQLIPMRQRAIKDSEEISESEYEPNGRHLVFLHGLFGKSQSFKFLAKNRKMQENFTVHLVDLRNHGESEWNDHMDYPSMANDLLEYLHKHKLTDKEKPVSLVGHSMGGKTALTFACAFPELVHQVVSLDAAPVDRLKYPRFNLTTQRMINRAFEIGDLSHLGYDGARRHIEAVVDDPIL